MKKLLPTLGLLTFAIGGIAAAQQQADDSLDIEAIRENAKRHAGEAEALAANVRERAQNITPEARTLQNEARQNAGSYRQSVETVSTKNELRFDFDAMIRDHAEAEQAAFKGTPRFIAFASLSMPAASLKALLRDMSDAGGVVVLRGFPEGDAGKFKARLAALWESGEETDGLGIDPRLFRAFGVTAAPTFVMASSDFEPCDGFDCTSIVPPFDRMTGNVSAAHVLERFASGGGPGAQLAGLHLKRLQAGMRP
ncbi:MAG: type-F conjugative transfer system pilin assembly protein TrbC [Parasphingorhabdus sp.]|nr:type-F conjugative transfer system pilin assembly protein TrbC [Sphingorhabdus sp. YGSMI21]ATW03259.1 type-F conjugative transfer system pilin assembly protein TrbC [Sphingorhabdus sp. YGSMI21]